MKYHSIAFRVVALVVFVGALAACDGPRRPVAKPPTKAGKTAPSLTVTTEPNGEGGAHETPPTLSVPDGTRLYRIHCAGCHGITGDGKGTTELETPARDFAAGGFAFGDTREALFKTVTAGLPGRSKMQGFKNILEDEERWAVVDHVRTLLPKTEEVKTKDTIMVVSDRPVVVRGKLPPALKGLPLRPRGLLIGDPDGLTFEFRTDDVRLLAVRQGPFAERTDWGGRGGSFLKPIGVVIHAVNGGDPDATFSIGNRALTADFTGSWIRDGRAGVSYRLLDAGQVVARVDESARVEGLSTGSAYTRHFAITTEVPTKLTLTVAKAIADHPFATDVTGDRCWTHRTTADGGAEAFRYATADRVLTAPTADLQVARNFAGKAVISVTVMPLAVWSPALIKSLDEELMR